MFGFWNRGKRRRTGVTPLPSRVVYSACNDDADEDRWHDHSSALDSNGETLKLTGTGAVEAMAARIAEFVVAGLGDRISTADVAEQTVKQIRIGFDGSFAHLAGQVSTAISNDIEERGRHVDGLIGRSLKPVADRVARAVVRDAESHWAAIRKDLSDTSIQAAQHSAVRPIVDHLIAVFDRIQDERAFLAAGFRKDVNLTLDARVRYFFEKYDAAIGSVATEILMILRGMGVEQTQANAGPFDPRTQKVVSIEDTARANLDGHVARVVRAGFHRGGTLIRPELVIVYRKAGAKS
mgnify:CR=1 FL=1